MAREERRGVEARSELLGEDGTNVEDAERANGVEDRGGRGMEPRGGYSCPGPELRNLVTPGVRWALCETARLLVGVAPGDSSRLDPCDEDTGMKGNVAAEVLVRIIGGPAKTGGHTVRVTSVGYPPEACDMNESAAPLRLFSNPPIIGLESPSDDLTSSAL